MHVLFLERERKMGLKFNLYITQIGITWFWYVRYAVEFSLYPITGNTKPTIDPDDLYIVVTLNTAFQLHCQGVKEMQWQREDGLKVRGERKVDGMSTLRIPRAQPIHMGRYICLEESSKQNASIYVFVKGSVGVRVFACERQKRETRTEI